MCARIFPLRPRTLHLLGRSLLFVVAAWGMPYLWSTSYRPPLWEALPLEETPQGVHARYPTAIHSGWAVPTSYTWRLVYRTPVEETPGSPPILSHGQANQAFSRNGAFDSVGQVERAPSAGPIRAARQSPWTRVVLFRQAFYTLEGESIRVCLLDPKTGRLWDEPFDPPEGMLLVEDSGPGILVLAVDREAPAGRAGLCPSDRIQACNGKPVQKLQDLLDLLKESKEEIAKRGGSRLPLEILRESPSEPQKRLTLFLPLPPSLESDVWGNPP